MKELKRAILSQNQRPSQGGGTGGPGPLSLNATNDKNLTKKNLFLRFQFLLASLRTTVHAYNKQYLTINNIDDQGARRTPLIQFFPPNLNV